MAGKWRLAGEAAEAALAGRASKIIKVSQCSTSCKGTAINYNYMSVIALSRIINYDKYIILSLQYHQTIKETTSAPLLSLYRKP